MLERNEAETAEQNRHTDGRRKVRYTHDLYSKPKFLHRTKPGVSNQVLMCCKCWKTESSLKSNQGKTTGRNTVERQRNK